MISLLKNILINSRTAVHSKSGGILATVDPCYTKQGEIVQFANVAYSKDAKNTATSVLINGHYACHMGSYFAKSYGDEAGSGGILSGTIGGKANFLSCSQTVFFEGKGVVRQGDLMIANEKNTSVSPLQQKGFGLLSPVELNALDRLDEKEQSFACYYSVAGKNSIASHVQIVFSGEKTFVNFLSTHKKPEIDSKNQYWHSQLQVTPAGQYHAWLGYTDVYDGGLSAVVDKDELVAKGYNPPDDSYWLPLGLIQAQKKSSSHKKAAISLMPLYLLRSLNKQNSKLDNLRSGWLYVYLDGYLWREIFVDQATNNFNDVNLTVYQGKNERPAHCTGERGVIILPYKVNDKKLKIEIAFSEIQWPWALIKHFGGMSHSDPRYCTKANECERYQRIKPRKKARKKRFSPLEIDNYSSQPGLLHFGFAQPAWVNKLKEQSQNQSGQLLATTQLSELKNTLPFYIVKDSIGIIRHLDSLFNEALLLWQKTSLIAKQDKWYYIAKINSHLARESKYKKCVELQEIESVTKEKKLQQYARKVHHYATLLFNFINEEYHHPHYFHNKTLTSITSDHVGLPETLEDFLVYNPEQYNHYVEMMAGWLATLSFIHQTSPIEKLVLSSHFTFNCLLAPTKMQMSKLMASGAGASIALLKEIAGIVVINDKLSLKVERYVNQLLSYGDTRLSVKLMSNKPVNSSELVTLKQLSNHRLLKTHTQLNFTAKNHQQFFVFNQQYGSLTKGVPLSTWLQQVQEKTLEISKNILFALNIINIGFDYANFKNDPESWMKTIADLSNAIAFSLVAADKHLSITNKFTKTGRALAKNLGVFASALAIPLSLYEIKEAKLSGNNALKTASYLSLSSSIGFLIVSAKELLPATLTKVYKIPLVFLEKSALGRALATLLAKRLVAAEVINAANTTLLIELSVLNIIVVLALILAITALIISFIYRNDLLQDWLVHGRFGKNPSLRFLNKQKGGKDEWQAWKNPQYAELAFINIISHFKIVLRENYINNTFIAVIVLPPIFILNKSKLIHNCKATYQDHNNIKHHLTINPNKNTLKPTPKQAILEFAPPITFPQSNPPCILTTLTLSIQLDIYANTKLILPQKYNGSTYVPTSITATCNHSFDNEFKFLLV